jgi:hypothetical protein
MSTNLGRHSHHFLQNERCPKLVVSRQLGSLAGAFGRLGCNPCILSLRARARRLWRICETQRARSKRAAGPRAASAPVAMSGDSGRKPAGCSPFIGRFEYLSRASKSGGRCWRDVSFFSLILGMHRPRSDVKVAVTLQNWVRSCVLSHWGCGRLLCFSTCRGLSGWRLIKRPSIRLEFRGRLQTRTRLEATGQVSWCQCAWAGRGVCPRSAACPAVHTRG